MTKLDPHDPRPLLALLLALVVLWFSRHLSGLSPTSLLSSAGGSLAPIAVGALVLASALAIQRLVSTARTLRSRRELAVIPADDFDPKPDAVLRFAAELVSTRRSTLGWLDRRASAVRVRLTRDPGGRLVYLLGVPERSVRLLRAALETYDGIEVRDAGDVLTGGDPGERLASVRTELVLGRSSLEPLARLALDPDPLQPFATALAGGRPHAGAEVSVCLDLLPASGHRRERLRRSLRRRASRQFGSRPGLLERLEGAGQGRRPGPDELLGRRLVNESLDAKLRESGTLFEAQILVRCRAHERSDAKAAMQHVLAAFEPFAAQNWLRPRGLGMSGLAFLGSDLPLRRGRFDRRLDTGLFRPARQMVLTAREISGFLKPPTVHCVSDDVARAGALLAAAPGLPAFTEGKAEMIPLGKIGNGASEKVVGVRTADTFFSYVAGRSRYGKTEMAVAQFVHLVRCGHGGLFLDPHGDALERIRPYLQGPALRRRVVEIDLGAGGPSALPGWNLFGLGEEGGEEERVAALVDAFSSVLEWGDRSTRAINLAFHSAKALVGVARVVPAEIAPTIFQLPTLLSDRRWREAALPFLPSSSRRFWRDRFPLLSPDAVTPVTNLVDRLRTSTAITTLLGQSEGTFRVREAMDQGRIVLACPGAGQTQERLVANLMVFDLLHSARRRAGTAAWDRKPFWAFLDEVQSYDGGGSGNLAGLLEQSAKFGLRATLLNQNPERLSPQTLNAVTTNRSHLISTALNSHAAALLTREWGGRPSPEVLVGLPRYRFVAQVTHEGELSRPFMLGGIRVEDVLDPDDAGGEVPDIPAVGLMEPAQVLEHLETLDERILACLQEHPPPEGTGTEAREPEETPLWLEEAGLGG
ncbi:MAG TPA: hypothetical protein VGC32_21975 [Solirubrobacterales bacterium]